MPLHQIVSRARRAELAVAIDGHDAAGWLDPHLLEFSFTDAAGGRADEVRITLHDRDGNWASDWMPQKGMSVTAQLTARDWFAPGEDVALPCGEFTIDEVEFSGPPDRVTVKALSAALTTGLRDTARTRAWEGASLRDVAGGIAAEHGLALHWQGEAQPFRRLDQRNESDLAFLSRAAAERGLRCKVHDGRLVILDEEAAEAQSPAVEIRRVAVGDEDLAFTPRSWSFRTSSADTDYDGATMSYADPQTGTTHAAAVERGRSGKKKAGDRKTLTVNGRAESAGEAATRAKAALREKNRKTETVSMEIMGHPGAVAGVTAKLSGFGAFSGTFLIQKAVHKVSGSGGYTTELEMTRTGHTPDVRVVYASDEPIPRPPRTERPGAGGGTAAPVPAAANIFRNRYDAWADRFDAVKNRLPLLHALTDVDKLLLCLPEIAAAEAERQTGPQDRQGWIYLRDMLQFWFGKKAGAWQANNEAFFISWDWAWSYQRVREVYAEFTQHPSEEPNRIFNAASRNKIVERLKTAGCFEGKGRSFDFLAADWGRYKDLYHNFIGVEGRANEGYLSLPKIDGLSAALSNCTLRALAAGRTERLAANHWRVHVERIGVFVHDVFNFDESGAWHGDRLGWWDCENKRFGLSALPGGKQLHNENFQSFRDNCGYGGDFLVLSDVHEVEGFVGKPYECEV